MTYNSKVVHEQGGSVLRIDSGGSFNFQSGANLDVNAGAKVNVVAGGSLAIDGGGVLTIGSAQIMWAASTTGPAGGPVNALPGSIFIRSDGSVTGLYLNVGVNGAGSVWASACINRP